MTDFRSLVHPGLYLMAFGVRWTYCVLMRYYLGRKETALGATKPRSFTSSLLFPSSCNPGLPIEAFVLLGAVMLEFLGELVMSFNKFDLLQNGQQMTVLIFFIIAFVIAMLKEYRIVTIPNLDYAVTVLAFLVKAFSFYSTSDASPLEAQLHKDVVNLCIILAVFLTLETACPRSPIVALVRCSAVTVLGSWMFNVAFILYFPYYETSWDQHSIKDMELATMIFTWHIAGALLIVFIMTSLAVCRVRKMSPVQVQENLNITYTQSSTKLSGKKTKYLVEQNNINEVL